MEESYVPPPKKLELFSGSGNRLGSPVPSSSNANPAAPTGSIPGAFPGAGAGAGVGGGGTTEERRESITTRFEVDLSAPNTSIQIRLADGTRYVFVFLSSSARLEWGADGLLGIHWHVIDWYRV